jgi:NTP pyrophosphatase (non-canonical NTP hydrolase)
MPAPKQQDTSFEEINQLIRTHMEERDWHNSDTRSLAISLSLEASELLEHYQWSDKPVGGIDEVGDELADVFIYGMQIAQQNDIDIVQHIKDKLKKAALKYPAADFKGKKGEEVNKAWQKNKLAYKKEGL